MVFAFLIGGNAEEPPDGGVCDTSKFLQFGRLLSDDIIGYFSDSLLFVLWSSKDPFDSIGSKFTYAIKKSAFVIRSDSLSTPFSGSFSLDPSLLELI